MLFCIGVVAAGVNNVPTVAADVSRLLVSLGCCVLFVVICCCVMFVVLVFVAAVWCLCLLYDVCWMLPVV